MKKTYIALACFLMVVCFISATQSLPIQKQYTNVNLIQNCENSTYSNITRIYYPNMTYKLDGNYAMTSNGVDDYNYTIYLETIGTWMVYGFCDENGLYTTWQYDFEVSPTGIEFDSILNNPLPLILFILGFLLLVFAISKNISWLGFVSAVLFIINGIYLMIYGFGGLNDMYTRAIAIVSLGVGLVVMFMSAYDMVIE